MTEVKFTLVGNIPAKKNNKQILRNRRTGKPFIASSNDYHKWQRHAMLQIKSQKKGSDLPLTKVTQITVRLFYGTLHAKDNTNTIESVHDLLVDCGVIIDDNWKVLPDTRQIGEYRKNRPGAEILIEY